MSVALLIALLLILGQSTPVTDPISGGAGWAGVGLLGLVLSWLLFVHLPAKDKQAEKKDERHAETVEALAKEFRAAVQDLTDSNKQAMQEFARHCEAEIDKVIDLLRPPRG